MEKILKFFTTALVMILTCFIGGAIGFFISSTLLSGKFEIHEIILFVIGIVIAFYLSIISHEAGHLVFGLISGYGFSSFRIASFMWIKQDGKINFRRLTVAGTGGQCLMTPPDTKEGKIPVIMYNLGGVIVNFIVTMIFVLLAFITQDYILVRYLLIFSAVISLFMGITNGIPLKMGGIANDGMNAIHLSKDPLAAEAFLNQLRMNAAQARGLRLSEMPDEWFTLPDGADMQNVHCASIAVFSAGRTLDKLDIVNAEIEAKALLESDYNIIDLHKNLIKCDLVFTRLLNYGSTAEISSILTMEQLKFMQSMKTFPSVIRTEYAIALIRDKDENKALKIKDDFDKIAKKYPYPSDIAADRELMELALKSYKMI